MHLSRHLGNKLEYHAAQTARPTNLCRLHNSIATSTAISQCDPIWQETQLQQVFNAIDGYVLRLGEGGTLVAVTLVRSNTSKFSWGKLAANHPFYDDPSPFYKRFTPIPLPPRKLCRRFAFIGGRTPNGRGGKLRRSMIFGVTTFGDFGDFGDVDRIVNFVGATMPRSYSIFFWTSTSQALGILS